MAKYKYIAKDDHSRTIAGVVSAENQASVLEELRKRKLTIISINESKESGMSLGKISFGGKSVKPDDLVIFARQLATMVDAGIPILEGLDALQEQVTHAYFKSVICAVRDDIEVGSSLSAAFAKHPRVFDNLFVNMVKVGETGGTLSAILDRVAGYMEKTLKLKRKVAAAMIYPIVVISMAIIITLVLLIKVVPTFKAIYDSIGQELPAMTQTLIFISETLQKGFLWVIASIIVMIILLVRFGRTEKGRLYIDTAKLKLPLFGDLIRKVAISRFCRTLATLIQSGVPILASLEIVGKTAGNKVIELVTNSVRDNVREGESITEPLAKSGVFPAMVTRMISVGEKTGEMGKMLTKVAEFYDDQVDTAVAGLTSIIEPLIIGVLGVVVGFIVIALFLPIIKMSTLIK